MLNGFYHSLNSLCHSLPSTGNNSQHLTLVWGVGGGGADGRGGGGRG